MPQAVFQCLSRAGINKEKREQDSGDFSHGKNLGPLLFKRRLQDIAFQFLRIRSSASFGFYCSPISCTTSEMTRCPILFYEWLLIGLHLLISMVRYGRGILGGPHSGGCVVNPTGLGQP
jgi:hypothetical protein